MYTMQGKPDKLGTYASHASPSMPLIHFLQQSMYMATFHADSTELDRFTATEKKGTPDYIPSTPADRSMAPHPISLPLTAIEAVTEIQTSVEDRLHQFTGSITLACDQYIQYLLAGLTQRSLTDMDGSYNLGGAGFPHDTPLPSQPMVLRFPLRPCPISN
jgi:hypothetical protein